MIDAARGLEPDDLEVGGRRLRMAAMLPCGQVLLYDRGLQVGQVIGADTPCPIVALVPELDAWIAEPGVEDAVARAAAGHYREARRGR